MTEAACPSCGHVEGHYEYIDGKIKGFRCMVMDCPCVIPRDTPTVPDWYADHTKDRGGLNVVGFSWILTRPEAVQRILVQFPPACVVRVKENGVFGVFLGVIDGTSDFLTLRVGAGPGAKTGIEFRPEDLEVVGYWNGLTPEIVASVIDAGSQQAVLPRKDAPGRNDPCGCGSGKKYKRCHGGGTLQKLIVPDAPFSDPAVPDVSPTREGLN